MYKYAFLNNYSMFRNNRQQALYKGFKGVLQYKKYAKIYNKNLTLVYSGDIILV